MVHWEINAQDPKALHAFYGDLFGWKINADNPMGYGLVTAGGDGINGGIGPAQGGPSHVTFYVRVADLDATLRKAGQLGASTVVPPTEIPNMVTFAVFTDPEGNRIGIIK
ncbi:MAG TPA: VOC family protein [bacterium]|nr:VOC family protein [bacterium]